MVKNARVYLVNMELHERSFMSCALFSEPTSGQQKGKKGQGTSLALAMQKIAPRHQ